MKGVKCGYGARVGGAEYWMWRVGRSRIMDLEGRKEQNTGCGG